MWSVACIIAEMYQRQPLFTSETDIGQVCVSVRLCVCVCVCACVCVCVFAWNRLFTSDPSLGRCVRGSVCCVCPGLRMYTCSSTIVLTGQICFCLRTDQCHHAQNGVAGRGALCTAPVPPGERRSRTNGHAIDFYTKRSHADGTTSSARLPGRTRLDRSNARARRRVCQKSLACRVKLDLIRNKPPTQRAS